MSEILRIGVIVGKWLGYGVETLMMNCYRYLDKSRVQFDFIIDEDSSKIPIEEIQSYGGRVFIVPPYQKPIAYHNALKCLFIQNKYRIVHAHISTLCVFPLWAAMTASVPIRIAHCHTTAGKNEYAKNTVKYILRPFSKMFPTHLATSSFYAGKWLFGNRAFCKGNMFFLPVARDLTQFLYNKKRREKMREKLQVEDKFVVGHLGRFVAQKNHSFLLQVFNEIHKLEPNSILLLAGDGDLLNSVTENIRVLGLEDCVLCLGRRSDAEDLYQAMDIYVLPSLYEGVPGTGIEAQAAGLPFIFADTITEEAAILESSKRLPFEIGAKHWAEVCVSFRNYERKNTLDDMTKAGYEIKSAAEKLESYYLALAHTLEVNDGEMDTVYVGASSSGN